MFGLGVVYTTIVLLGYDRWLMTLRKRPQERLLLQTLMQVLALQAAVVLLAAAVLCWRR